MNQKYVYKITYPNGKIYVGQDRAELFMTYFGSSQNKAAIEKDFTAEQKKNFSIRKEILWLSEDATRKELNQQENMLIVQLEANNPEKGYNLRPKYVKKEKRKFV